MSREVIGECILPCLQLGNGVPVDQWFDIYHKGSKKAGEISMVTYMLQLIIY
jgi:hypothetical protein